MKEEQSQWEEKFSSSALGGIGQVKLEVVGEGEGAQTPTAEFDEQLEIGDHRLSADESSPASQNCVVLRPNRSAKQKSARWERQKWLQNRVPFTYTELIAMAINSQPDQRATLAEIYEYLRVNFDCFRGSYTGWKNCIRHTLTLAKSFQKVPRAERAGRVGLGNYWALSDYFHRRNLAGGIGRRSRKAQFNELLHTGGTQKYLHSKETATQSAEKSVFGSQNNTANHWEQQQSNDVENLLRLIGIPTKSSGQTQQKEARDREHGGNAEEHRPRELTAALSAEGDADTESEGQSRRKQNGTGKKLDLLLDKMGHLRRAECPPALLPSSSSATTHFHDSAILTRHQPSFSRHHPKASSTQTDHLPTHCQPFTSSLASPLYSPMCSRQKQIQWHQQKQRRSEVDEEVITVEEEDTAEAEEQKKVFIHSAGGPSVAAVAQVSAWLGLVAGEMRLRLQCDGKNGSMVLSPNFPGRAVHRLQFVPGNERELTIRQFSGDQLCQEKRWTWHDHQEEQTLHAIRGICFHFFFCR